MGSPRWASSQSRIARRPVGTHQQVPEAQVAVDHPRLVERRPVARRATGRPSSKAGCGSPSESRTSRYWVDLVGLA